MGRWGRIPCSAPLGKKSAPGNIRKETHPNLSCFYTGDFNSSPQFPPCTGVCACVRSMQAPGCQAVLSGLDTDRAQSLPCHWERGEMLLIQLRRNLANS